MEDNEPLHFPQEMLDMFAEISRQQEAQVRQCKTIDEEELMPFAGEKCIPPSEEEWNELIDALNLLNEKTAKDKNSYLSRFKDKYLPIKVKIEDLEDQPSREEVRNCLEREVRLARQNFADILWTDTQLFSNVVA